MALLLGTSGWHYAHWRGVFYPASLPASRWLEHYAARFQVVEVNSTFYRLPEASAFRAWAAETPADFVFALKLSRFATHLKRLKDPEAPVALFLDRARSLGGKLGPVLVQVPSRMKRDAGRLDAALAAFPPGVRVAVELRDETWRVPEIEAVLGRRGAALCAWDRAGAGAPLWRTADFGYLRFHEGLGRPRPCYEARALAAWARRVHATWPEPCDVYAFFNNDALGCAVRDAGLLAKAAGREGLTPTRVPQGPEARAPRAA